MQPNNPPYQPRTGVAARQVAAHQQQQFQPHQKPIDLFDPNFVGQGGPGDQAGLDPLFGAQNMHSRAGGATTLNSAPDLSNMSDRDRRIFLRDQERANRNMGGASSNTAGVYGLPDAPPVQMASQKPNLFGEAASSAPNRRDDIWQQKLTQRQAPGLLPPPLPPSNNLGMPSQGQGFTQATQVNQSLNMVNVGGPTMQMPSPNRAHRKLKAVGESPLRKSNIMTSAAAQQSPMRNSITAQKFQQAKELDNSIQGGYDQNVYGTQTSQRNSVGLPPTGSKAMAGGGLMDALSGSDANRRRADQRAMQQNEYNQFLSQQSQKPGGMRQRSASGRQEVGSALATGGMQMIGGHQIRQQEDKKAQQREYQQHLQEQMMQKQHTQLGSEADKLSDARKNQLSDQIFNDVMRNQQQPQAPQAHPQQQQNPYANQVDHMQQPGRPVGLPPRVQSAGRGGRQQQSADVDPFHKNRQDENDAKRRELEKKKEYGAMLQAQMAQKKQGRQSSLPAPDQLFDQPPNVGAMPQQMQQMPQQMLQQMPQQQMAQQQMPQQQMQQMPQQQLQQQQQQYPQNNLVDFSQLGQPAQMAPPMQPPQYQPSYQQQDSRPKYSLDQQISFDQNPGPGQMGQLPPRGPYQQPTANVQTNQNTEVAQQQQRSRQDEYRRQLEDQIRLDKDKKMRIKQEDERYEMRNNKDMAQYMGLEPSAKQAQVEQQQQQQQQQQMPPPGMGPPQMPQWQQPEAPKQQVQNQAVQNGQPSGIRINTDITKPQAQVDEKQQQARLRHQQELREQMQEAKARKEALKQKEKDYDNELERKLQVQQQNLTQQEVAEIKREGGKAPEIKENKKVRIDQFQPSGDNKSAAIQNNFMEQEAAKPPPDPSNDGFMKPQQIVSQPLQMNVAGPDAKQDLFGQGPPMSMLPPPGPGFGAGPMPPGGQGFQPATPLGGPGGLQSPFGDQPASSHYSQFAPPGMQIQNAQMASQSDWMDKQQQQASRMFEDQAKMIQMYQQALEQIMTYRQQSFEQAMVMRENVLKEREQTFEDNKAEKREMAEMNQIAALKNQLGNMLQVADQQNVPMINPQVANDLNKFLAKQNNQIKTEMTQSNMNMNMIMQQAQFQQQQQMAPVPLPEKELPVTSQQVQIPQAPARQQQQFLFSPSQDEGDLDLQKQVDDLAAQIAAGGADQQQRRLTSADERRLAGHSQIGAPPAPLQQHQQQLQPAQDFQRNPQFEISLSSESKMVKVPNQGLLAMAAQAAQAQHDRGQSPVRQPADMLTETWNQASAQKALVNAGVFTPDQAKPPKTPFSSALNQINAVEGQQSLMTPTKRIGGAFQPRSPSITKSGMPQPIQELPLEEEKPQTNYDGMRNTADYFSKDKKSEYDLNNRANDFLSGSSSPPRQFVTIEGQEMDAIERLVQQQTQSAWVDRRATMTGTSFYDNHRRTQKLQEQTQQEEMQRQLKRILDGTGSTVGNESDPLKAMQEAVGPDMIVREQSAIDLHSKHSNTMQVRASQDKLIRQPFQINKVEHDEPKRVQGDYQASGKNPLANTNFNLPQPSQDSSLSEINIAATDQSGNLREMQIVNDTASAQDVVSKRTYQPSDVHNISGFTEPSQKQPSERQKWNLNDKQSEAKPPSMAGNTIWDDPDLVPMPVLPDFADQSIGGTYDQNQQEYFRAGRDLSPAPDQTMMGLRNMDPELIKTKEFSAYEKQTIHDETAGMSEFDHQYPQQRFQTYRQSEPVSYDVAPSMPTHTVHQQSQSVIPTQIDISQRHAIIHEELKTGRSKKQERDMADIQDIMRRAAHVAAVSDSTQKELVLKRAMRGGETGESWHKPAQIKAHAVNATPSAPKTGKQALIGLGLESEKMQTAAANVAPHRLGQMQRAAREISPPPVQPQSNDMQMMTDLDRIIANLEMQQKNMATFGVPPLPEDPEEDATSEHQKRVDTNLREENAINIATPVTKNYGPLGRPMSGKAPLDPRSAAKSMMTTQTAAQPPVAPFLRPASGQSNQSRHTVATKAMNRNASNMMIQAQEDDQNSNQGFRQTAGQMTVLAGMRDGQQYSSSKLAYHMDEDDDKMATTGKKNHDLASRDGIHPALSESGHTQMTAVHGAHQVNIAEESQDGQNL